MRISPAVLCSGSTSANRLGRSRSKANGWTSEAKKRSRTPTRSSEQPRAVLNDEARRTNDEGMAKFKYRKNRARCSFDNLAFRFIRHSSFLIFLHQTRSDR